ncbi:DNA polymerase V [Escherichia coli]|nr:DNA polymerase V [Escherichia coli]
MPRYDDKISAFNRSITREPSGRKIVRTSAFVRNLAALNHDMSPDEANRWIRLNARTFRDASTEEGDDKLWFQFNPNWGL